MEIIDQPLKALQVVIETKKWFRWLMHESSGRTGVRRSSERSSSERATKMVRALLPER